MFGSTYDRKLTASSWPDLIRPSNSAARLLASRLDARIKSAHDARVVWSEQATLTAPPSHHPLHTLGQMLRRRQRLQRHRFQIVADDWINLDLQLVRLGNKICIDKHRAVSSQNGLHPIRRNVRRSNNRSSQFRVRGQQFKDALVIFAGCKVSQQWRALQILWLAQRRCQQKVDFLFCNPVRVRRLPR